MTDEEKLATIRWNNACGSPGAQREVKFLLERLDALTSPPTHDERQEGLSDSHSESYRLGWRAGRAEVERLRAQVADAFDQGWIARAERDRPLTYPSLAVLAATPPPRSLNPYRAALASGDEGTT